MLIDLRQFESTTHNYVTPPPCVIDIQGPQGCPFIKVSSLFGHYAEFGGAAGGENAGYLQLEFGLFNKKLPNSAVHV